MRATRGEALLLIALDALLVSGLFALAYVLRFQFGLLAMVDVPPPPPAEYGQALLVLLAVFLLVFRSRGLYEDFPARGIDLLEGTLTAVNIASVLVLAASFFHREFTYSRTVVVLTWAMATVTLPLPRLALLARRRRRWARGVGLLPAVIVGSRRRAGQLFRRLQRHRRYGLDVRGIVVVEDEGAASEAADDVPELGLEADLEGVVGSNGIREVLLSETLERLKLLELLETCERIPVEARIVPHIYDLFVTPNDLAELHGVPFLAIREQRYERLSLALKRLFDLVVGTLLLVLAAPVIAVFVVLVRRESAGSALFAQRRVGQNGRVFLMWKLRSMVVDAEERLQELVDLDALEQPVFKFEDDPRVTRVGRVIRRWSLDELPQLWNVVKGDMSLVGPRPEWEEVVARYDAHHRRRLKAKPGLTGLQQVEARAASDLDDRVRLDVYYTRRRSFLFDLYILARTPWAVAHGRGAV